MNKFVKIGLGIGIALVVWFVVGLILIVFEEPPDSSRFNGLSPYQINEVLHHEANCRSETPRFDQYKCHNSGMMMIEEYLNENNP